MPFIKINTIDIRKNKIDCISLLRSKVIFLRILFLVSFLLIQFSKLYSQKPETDSIKKVIMLIKRGSFNDGLKLVNELIKESPSNIDNLYYRATIYYMQGKLDSALIDYTSTIKLSGNIYKSFNDSGKELDAYLCRSNVYSRLGQMEPAITDAEKSLKLNPKNPMGFLIRGQIKSNLSKDYSNAILDFSAALKMDSLNSNIWYNRGESFLNLQMYKNAISDFSSAIKLIKDTLFLSYSDYDCYYKLGVAYMSLNFYKEAIKYFRVCFRYRRENWPELYYNYAYCNYKVGENEVAYNNFKKGCENGDIKACDFFKKLLLEFRPNCKELTLQDLRDIKNADNSNRINVIQNKGFTFLKSAVEYGGYAQNSAKKVNRIYYLKCDTSIANPDALCSGALMLTLVREENTVLYSTYNFEYYLSLYNSIKNESNCGKMMTDVTLREINENFNGIDIYDFMEVYCCTEYCYVFLILNHKCADGKNQKVYQIAVSSRQ